MRPLSISTLLVSIIALFVGLWLLPVSTLAQESDNQKRAQEQTRIHEIRRTQEIVAYFNKEKHVVKEKFGIRKEKYKKIVSEPVIKQNIKDYSGVYEVQGLGFLIDIQVGNDGKVNATGAEPVDGDNRQARRFRLEGARITGAMLAGTKVYEDGATEKFEGVFINRTDFDSPTDKGSSAFGLGVVGNPVEFAGVTLDRLFYQLKQ